MEKKELLNLAQEMRTLDLQDRQYFLYAFTHCRELNSPTCVFQNYLRRMDRFQSFKKTLKGSLSFFLTGKNEEIPVVQQGLEAFMSASKDEREEFYRFVLNDSPTKIAAKPACNTPSPEESRTHE